MNKKILRVLGGLLLGSLALSGCASLKKKFIRKKKTDKKESFVPVLDPVDYPASRVTAAQRCAYHYSLWRVWTRDLEQALDQQAPKKTQRYLFEKILEQVEEMKGCLPEERRPGLEEYAAKVRAVESLLAKPAAFRDAARMKRTMQRIDKAFRREFRQEMKADARP